MKLLKKIILLDFHPIVWFQNTFFAWMLKDHTALVNEQLNKCFKKYDDLLSDFNKEQRAYQAEISDWFKRTAKSGEDEERRHKELIQAIERAAKWVSHDLHQ